MDGVCCMQLFCGLYVFCLTIKTVEMQFNALYVLPSAGTTTLLA